MPDQAATKYTYADSTTRAPQVYQLNNSQCQQRKETQGQDYNVKTQWQPQDADINNIKETSLDQIQ